MAVRADVAKASLAGIEAIAEPALSRLSGLRVLALAAQVHPLASSDAER